MSILLAAEAEYLCNRAEGNLEDYLNKNGFCGNLQLD